MNQETEIPVIYSDGDILVVDKPAGVLSLPDGYDHAVPYLRRLLEPLYGRLWVVHRLDRETSGVIVLARSPEAHRALSLQFAERQVSKIYHAIVDGEPEWEEKMLDLPLRVGVGRHHRTVVDLGNGKPARTRFRILERLNGYALLSAAPETGRTHQIRAHLYDLAFSILSDPLYGHMQASPYIDRMALHARSLTFWHPSTGEMVTFESAYPADFEFALAQLRYLAVQG